MKKLIFTGLFVFLVVITINMTTVQTTPQNTFTAQVENAAITFNDTGQAVGLENSGTFTAQSGLTQFGTAMTGRKTDTAMIDTGGQENLLNSINFGSFNSANINIGTTAAITFNENAEDNYKAGTVLNLMKKNTGAQLTLQDNNLTAMNYIDNAANKEQQMKCSITAANNFTAQAQMVTANTTLMRTATDIVLC